MRKILLSMAALGAVGYGVVHWRTHAAKHATPAQAELVTNRLWIDHMPKNDRDTIQVFLTIDEDNVGVFQAGSGWKGSYEMFRYESHGGELRIVYPQTGDKETVKAKATACREAGFDYCLELSGGTRGVQRYYSMRDWELDSMPAADAKIKALEMPASDPSSARK
jgi:hypothetical protein